MSATRCPWAGEGRGRPQGQWLSLCSLGGCGARASGRAEARPSSARKSSRRTYRIANCLCTAKSSRRIIELPIVCVRGSPFGAQKKSLLAPLLLYLMDLYQDYSNYSPEVKNCPPQRLLVSSPEHFVLMVSYYGQSMSVVRRPLCSINNYFKSLLLLHPWAN